VAASDVVKPAVSVRDWLVDPKESGRDRRPVICMGCFSYYQEDVVSL